MFLALFCNELCERAFAALACGLIAAPNAFYCACSILRFPFQTGGNQRVGNKIDVLSITLRFLAQTRFRLRP